MQVFSGFLLRPSALRIKLVQVSLCSLGGHQYLVSPWTRVLHPGASISNAISITTSLERYRNE